MMPRYLVSRSGLRAYASSLITDEITVVLLPDALAAVAAIEQQHGEESHGHYMDGYVAGLSAARDAVPDNDHRTDLDINDYDTATEYGLAIAKAAIDALKGEQT